MNPLSETNIIKFLHDNIEPLEDHIYRLGYRVSVTLKDGTFLPCVIFRHSTTYVNVAIERFGEKQSNQNIAAHSPESAYRETVKSFIVRGNCISKYDVAKIDKSRFAFPVNILKQIRGETSMSWNALVARFKDGRQLSFGTTWHLEFFDLPESYYADDIIDIVNHSYLLKTGEVVGHHSSFDRATRKNEMEKIHGDRLFFECFIDNL
jgi:hypothetical protein